MPRSRASLAYCSSGARFHCRSKSERWTLHVRRARRRRCAASHRWPSAAAASTPPSVRGFTHSSAGIPAARCAEVDLVKDRADFHFPRLLFWCLSAQSYRLPRRPASPACPSSRCADRWYNGAFGCAPPLGPRSIAFSDQARKQSWPCRICNGRIVLSADRTEQTG